MINNKLEYWIRDFATKIIPTVYDDSMSYYELLNKIKHYLNLTVDQVNALTDAFNVVISETLPENVETVLNAWYDSGRILELINLEMMSSKVDVITYAADKAASETAIGAVDTKINSHKTETAKIYSNVMDYGAIGDGNIHPLSERFATLAEAQAVYPRALSLTEQIDGNAIQKAIDELPVSRYLSSDIPTGGGVILLPRGTFQTSKPILYRNSVTIQGSGKFSTKIRMTDYLTDILVPEYYSGETGIRGLCIFDIGLEHGGSGIVLDGVARANIRNVSLRANGKYGIYSNRCVGNSFNNIFIYGAGIDGVYVVGTSGGMNTTQWFTDLTVVHCIGWGITISGGSQGVEGCTFDNVIVEYNGNGIRVDGGLTPALTFLNTFRNVWHEGNTGYDFRLITGYETVIENSMGHINIEGAVNTTVKNVKGDIVILAAAGKRYFQGFITGSFTDPSPANTVRDGAAIAQKKISCYAAEVTFNSSGIGTFPLTGWVEPPRVMASLASAGTNVIISVNAYTKDVCTVVARNMTGNVATVGAYWVNYMAIEMGQ